MMSSTATEAGLMTLDGTVSTTLQCMCDGIIDLRRYCVSTVVNTERSNHEQCERSAVYGAKAREGSCF